MPAMNQDWFSPDTKSTSALILDLQLPELGEIFFCCLQATQVMVFSDSRTKMERGNSLEGNIVAKVGRIWS